VWETERTAQLGQHLLHVAFLLVRNAILQSLLALE
jgi:ubiquitin C-terminal hydrolase